MTQYRVQVHYQRALNEKWSNVYHVEAANLATAAITFEDEGVPKLLQLLDSSCSIVSLLVSDETTDTFTTVPINLSGTSTASGDLLPLFNACKVLVDQASGRPDMKYLKGFITESIQTGGVLNSGTITSVDGIFTDMIVAMAAGGATLVSNTGEEWVTVSIQPAVQMRQMHRKRKKSTPSTARRRIS